MFHIRLLVFLMALLHRPAWMGAAVSRSVCRGSSKIECLTKGQCISLAHVCNGARDCADNSDEDKTLCQMWKFNSSGCSAGRIGCGGRCYGHQRYCRLPECAASLHPDVCTIVRGKRFSAILDEGRNKEEEEKVKEEKELPEEEELEEELEEEEVDEEELEEADAEMMSLYLGEFFSGDDESSLEMVEQESATEAPVTTCPSLYTPVGGRCLALFTLAKVPWAEARQFCQSISGKLVTFEDPKSFDDILKYLAETALTTDFWIGGRFNSSASAWMWENNNLPMPLGSPFWGIRYSSSCVPRAPVHTDPYHPPPPAVPGAPCYNYLQAPKQRQQGWCAAITYEQFYYITDEMCQDKRSPLCVLTTRSPPSHPINVLSSLIYP